MTEIKEPILISVSHHPFFLSALKSELASSSSRGMSVLMEEAAFNSDEEAKQFMRENGLTERNFDYLLKKAPYGSFFPGMVRFAKERGLTVIPAEDPEGMSKKIARDYYLECWRVWDGYKKEELSAFATDRRLKKAARRLRYQSFLHSKARSQNMFERIQQHNPDLVVVGLIHGRHLRKMMHFSQTKFVGNPLARGLHPPIYWIAGKVTKGIEGIRKRIRRTRKK